MKAKILIITGNTHAAGFINARKESLIPLEYRIEPAAGVFSVQSLLCSRDKAEEGLAREMGRVAASVDSLIAIWDVAAYKYLSRFCPSAFNMKVTIGNHSQISGNYFQAMLAKAIREFITLKKFLMDAKNMKCLLLPVDNFDAEELRELIPVGKGERSGNVRVNLEEFMAQMRERITPKKFSKLKQTYIRDDNGNFFEYANERHSKSETSIPPHNQFCMLNGQIRFGVKFDRDRHYNVTTSSPRVMSGCTFVNCHGERILCRNTTHINMFPNCFF